MGKRMDIAFGYFLLFLSVATTFWCGIWAFNYLLSGDIWLGVVFLALGLVNFLNIFLVVDTLKKKKAKYNLSDGIKT